MVRMNRFCRLPIAFAGLQSSSFKIVAILLHKLFVCAGLHNLPLVEYQNPIGAPQSAKTVGDNESSATAHGSFHGSHDFVLGFWIDGRKCIVKDQDWRF